MKYFPDQYGPVSVDFLLRTIDAQSTIEVVQTQDYQKWFSSDVSNRQTSDEKRKAIKDVFEAEKYAFERTGECIDYFAVYLPHWKPTKTWGVYFIARSCIKAVKDYSDIDRIAFLECILAHEIGHAFIENELGEGASAKHLNSHQKYCELEEALCNLMAIVACEKGLKIQIGLKPKDTLLRLKEQGGLSGYGDYNKITSNMIKEWKKFITDEECQSISWASEVSYDEVANMDFMRRWIAYYKEWRTAIPVFLDTYN